MPNYTDTSHGAGGTVGRVFRSLARTADLHCRAVFHHFCNNATDVIYALVWINHLTR